MSIWLNGGIRLLSASGNAFPDSPQTIVQQGLMFHCSSLSASVADNANLDMMITSIAFDNPHMIIEAAAGGSSELLFYEGTVATGGTPEVLYNLKRTSTKTFNGTVVTNPTVSNAGTLLSSQFMPGGNKNQAIGGDASFNLEWILKSAVPYLIRLTNRSGGAVRASIGCNHYSVPLTQDI